jgi:hypothetical protein
MARVKPPPGKRPRRGTSDPSYLQSVHGRAIAAGNDKAANCNSCHGNHDIYPARDARSHVNHWRVAESCAQCHTEIAKTYNQSIHGEASRAPVCVDCHGDHLIVDPKNPASPVNAPNVSAETCARCHASARMANLYDIPADRVPPYADSYHGLELRGGKLTAANCASCYGVHNIFRSPDARSTMNVANLGKTCGQCHQGANEGLCHRAGARADRGRPESSGGEMDSLDVRSADPGDARLHAAAQLVGSE